MATTYTESADKRTLTVAGEAPPYTTEEAYNKLVTNDSLQDGEIAAVKAGTFPSTWHTNLVNAADDIAANTAGVAIGRLYRTGSVIKVRVA